MRELLALIVALHTVIAQDVGLNLPCNKEMDGLLAADPDGNKNAFLSCQGVGVGTIGFWERRVCPNDMIFDFINQQCKTPSKKARKQQSLNIAILNNSCARGETCIGGTVCDIESLKCLCPYGTLPQMDTLSCIKSEATYVNTDNMPSTFTFNSFGGFEKSPINSGYQSTSHSSSALPGFFQPNLPFSKFGQSYGSNNNNNNYGANNNNNNNFNFVPNFNNNNNNNNGGNLFGGNSNTWVPNPPNPPPLDTNNNFGNFMPNPNQKFVFAGNLQPVAPMTPAPPSKKIPILARPGQTCRDNEICGGGSICTLPIGLCLCPGDLEESEGECVLPAASTIQITKVGIGAQCNELAECDHGSSCLLGRCACFSPLVQHEGKCVLKQERVEVGPGELCDNGEVCVKGSVCDSVIPVCVCPHDTDLSNGECIRISSEHTRTHPIQHSTAAATPMPTTRQTYPPATTQAPITQAPVRTSQPSNQGYSNTNNNNFNSYMTSNNNNNAQGQGYPGSISPYQGNNQKIHPTTYNYKTAVTVSPIKSTSKPNQMKINLGGSKQAGVGVRCSLNTDCMIGAYCNGNTNPPSCQCLSTHVNIDGRCEKVVYPGQVGCRNDLQCSAAYASTSCIDRICVCPEGSKAVDQTCVPANEPVTSPPGGSCSDARQCNGGSICREGWCICPDPTMIVQKGICIQSGSRPTLPPRTFPVYSTSPSPPVYQTVPQTYHTTPPTTQQQFTYTQPPPPSTYQPTIQQVQTHQQSYPHVSQPTTNQGRKAVPGSQCGPLDICVGGSMCVDGLCVCPAGQHPSSKNGRCEISPPTASPTQPPPPPPSPQTPPGTRRPPAYIELPTHAPLTTAQSSARTRIASTSRVAVSEKEDDSECTSIGLYCRGNTVCRNKSCQCPDGYVLHNDGCIPPDETGRRKVRGKARHQVMAPVYSRPNEMCNNGQVCTGYSQCSAAGTCVCPLDRPVVLNSECIARPQPRQAAPGESCDENTQCTQQSTCTAGQCRCGVGYMAMSGQCVALPMPTTPAMKTIKFANPLESCENGETCDGGATCDEDTGVCMCRPGQIVFGIECQSPPGPNAPIAASPNNYANPPASFSSFSQQRPTTECENDTNCGDNKLCVVGKCKCKPGYVDNGGLCQPLEDMEMGERPVPISYAKHKVETLSSERVQAEEEDILPSTSQPTPRTPSRQETQKPRIVGPPIRRPKPKPKNRGGSSGSSGTGTSSGTGNYKTGSGNGNCPPGNDPTRDDAGRLITCNGLEPNCPPRSYCYVTSGGFATEEYNCCKSW